MSLMYCVLLLLSSFRSLTPMLKGLTTGMLNQTVHGKRP